MKNKVIVFLSVMALCFFVAGCGASLKTYTLTGRIMDGNEGVAGVKISCSAGETITDENGFYKLTDLTTATEITVSKDDCVFDEPTKIFYTDTKTLDFTCYKYYDLSGKVLSGGLPISNAVVNATGKRNGKTTTDANGNFLLKNIAGDVTISVESGNIQFVPVVANKFSGEVILDSKCKISGRVMLGDDGLGGVTITSGQNSILTNEDGTFEIVKDSSTNVIFASKQNYTFKDANITLSSSGETVEFVAYQNYSVSGQVVCGNRALDGVKISSKKNPQNFATTNENGEFSLNGLYYNDVLVAEKQGFDFEEISISAGMKDLKILATFQLVGVVNSDDNCDGFTVSAKDQMVTTKDYTFVLDGIKFGDVITAQKSGYYCQKASVTVDSLTPIAFDFYKLFNLNGTLKIDGEVAKNFEVDFAGQKVQTNEDGQFQFLNLHGSGNFNFDSKYFVSLSKTGKIDFQNNNVDVELFKIYSTTLSVFSGDLQFAGAEVSIDGKNGYKLNENSQLTFENIYGSKDILLKMAGYNTKVISISKVQTIIDVELTYDVSGFVSTKDVAVASAKVCAGSKYVLTDENGYYQLKDLVGQNEIYIQKDLYDFKNSIAVSKMTTANFDGTYSIAGTVSGENGLLSNVIVVIIDENSKSEKTTTNENGGFSFENLYGSYYLTFEQKIELKNLRPNGYNIVEASSKLDFSTNGYSVGGKIVCGAKGVANVLVTAGSVTTTTDDDGNYLFDVLFGDATIIPQKDGYDFGQNIAVTDIMDGRTDLDFNATYSIYGTIKSGEKLIDGVLVKLGNQQVLTNENGEYSFRGITKDLALDVSKDGYNFVGNTNVTCAGEFNFDATYKIAGTVVCGDSVLANLVIYYGNNSVLTKEDGRFEIANFVYGNELKLEKDGYQFTFESDLSAPQDDLLISSTYKIAGFVASGENKLSGTTILIGESKAIADANGYFEIVGLAGTNLLSIDRAGYDKVEMDISEYKNNLHINLTFGLSGTIKLFENGLAGVKVFANGNSTTTDKNGTFKLLKMFGSGNLSFEKTGYGFVGDCTYTSEKQFEINATYSVVGYVKTGNVAVENVNINYLSKTIKTDADGRFEIAYLSEKITIGVEKDGYNPQNSGEICYYEPNLVFNLTYNVSGKIEGLADNSQIKVVASSVENKFETSTNASGEFSFNNLCGQVSISFEKENVGFTPSTFVVSGPIIKDVEAYHIYSISGKVTAGSLSVYGMTITAGKLSTKTDTNGNYAINGISGTVAVQGELKCENCTTISTGRQSVSDSKIINFSIEQNDYVFFMFERAYQNLRESKSYYSTMNGSVDCGAGGTQTVGGYRKKGTNGAYLKEDTNYGKTVFGIDPKVAVLTYFKDKNSVSYVQHKDVSSSLVANYSGKSWTETTFAQYADKYGWLPDDFYPYIINKSTIKSFDNIAVNNGETTFTLNLDANASTTKYKKRMASYSGQTPSEFYAVKLTYKLNSVGNLISVDIYETYKVSVANCTGNIKETFVEINGSSVGEIARPTL